MKHSKICCQDNQGSHIRFYEDKNHDQMHAGLDMAILFMIQILCMPWEMPKLKIAIVARGFLLDHFIWNTSCNNRD